jgi:type II secretory ATPase GspE/PulE/Tfp pilus assembly ATPase PilB-like protein
MRQDAILKALDGKISMEEVLRVTEGEQIWT